MVSCSTQYCCDSQPSDLSNRRTRSSTRREAPPSTSSDALKESKELFGGFGLFCFLAFLLRSLSLRIPQPIGSGWSLVRFIGFVECRPFLLFGSAYIRIVPGSTTLHVRNIFLLDFSRFDLILGIKDRKKMIRVSLLKVLLECLQGSRLEGLRTVRSIFLFRFRRLFLLFQLLPLFRGHSIRNISCRK